MVGAGGVRGGDSLSGEVPEGFEPPPEERAEGFVALQIDAADSAGAVVQVEENVRTKVV